MGKGKGNLAYWIAGIKKGTVLFEISGLNMKKAEYVLEKSKTKLPVRTKITKNIY
jgi:large subunit ribosomal protein L16